MLSDHSAVTARRDIVRLCHSGLDSISLRSEAMRRLRQVLPIESFWFATADPATLLFTGSLVDEIPEEATPLFVANEFLQNDVNKFTQLAVASSPVSTLHSATKGRLEESSRYRDICVPLGFGDEMRAAIRAGGACWGFMCLHRDVGGLNFSPAEMDLLAELVPHLAGGLRSALLLEQAADTDDSDGPGLLLLANDLSLVGCTPSGERWLAEIADRPFRHELPQVIHAAVARLALLESNVPGPHDFAPRGRVRTSSGRWLVVHASRISGRKPAETAIILEPARPLEIAELLLQAYGLTRREGEVAQLVLRGRSTAGIVSKLQISEYTVQQHLKAIFTKVGIGSRRELVAQAFAQQHRSRVRAS
ncbi:helix-turn-helix transcriptional regulator [Mesorhizobium sp. M0213]|uniref:helix-turn-helix transcriptional regulator n=1 Tax=Mesorhizobium sp. M0213 TaxID=2956917 RepID=UPI00333D0B99